MKFNDLDKKMRAFETVADHCVLPGIYMVARIDGRCFTKLIKEKCHFEVPFDEKFRDMMVETTKHLMTCGFDIRYGYTESDEISLLFDLNSEVFNRKTRKYNSILAGEASSKFTLLLGDGNTVSFDCRISQLPGKNNVIDYFSWRSEDASRNALNSYCYWTLIKNEYSKRKASEFLNNKTVLDKNEILFRSGINFNNVPNWTKRGVGLYWKDVIKEGFNPKEKKSVKTVRRIIETNYDLPMKEEYKKFIHDEILCCGPRPGDTIKDHNVENDGPTDEDPLQFIKDRNTEWFNPFNADTLIDEIADYITHGKRTVFKDPPQVDLSGLERRIDLNNL